MIHIYYGDGKGKTTAALGLAARAAGRGLNVIIAQFLKARDTGELDTLSEIECISLLRADIEAVFSFQMTPEQKRNAFDEHMILFEKAANLCKNKNTLLILDEIIGTLNENLIDHDLVMEFLRKNRADIEIVLTGRNPSEEILALGDYITEMKKIKHPYDDGVKMRKGIEY